VLLQGSKISFYPTGMVTG